jgi:hypothetical protein
VHAAKHLPLGQTLDSFTFGGGVSANSKNLTFKCLKIIKNHSPFDHEVGDCLDEALGKFGLGIAQRVLFIREHVNCVVAVSDAWK